MGRQNPYSRNLGGVIKSEAGIVATGIVLGGVGGATVGFAVSQVAGTPLVPSMAVGGAAGAAIGGGVGVYYASRLDNARAKAVLEADELICKRLDVKPKDQSEEFAEHLAAALIQQAAPMMPTLMQQVAMQQAQGQPQAQPQKQNGGPFPANRNTNPS